MLECTTGQCLAKRTWRFNVYNIPLSSAACAGSFVYPTLCSFKASYSLKVSLLSQYIRRRWTHVNGRGDERVDIRLSRVFIDQLYGETLGSAGFSACSDQGSKCPLDVDSRVILKLGRGTKVKEQLERLITYIQPCPFVGINNSIKNKMTNALQDDQKEI